MSIINAIIAAASATAEMYAIERRANSHVDQTRASVYGVIVFFVMQAVTSHRYYDTCTHTYIHGGPQNKAG